MEVSSVIATLCFSCVPNRTLATDTCSFGLVQVFPFSRCVVRVLALGIHTARFHRAGVIFAGVCASGPLGDWEKARRNSPADLKHTQLPAAKKDDVTRRHKHPQHSTVTTPRHEHAIHLCTSLVPSFIHSFIHSFLPSFFHSFFLSFIHSFMSHAAGHRDGVW